MNYDVIIVGGGAAGLFCAIEAGKRGRKTLVIEHNAEVGRKIIISGGGRCNFTNIRTRPENFVSHNPHFCKSALARFTPQDLLRLVRKHKIEHYEKKLGQMFCRGSSREIVEMLLDECRRASVDIRTQCRISEVSKPEQFIVKTSQGDFESQSLVIASGGLSFQKIGATDLGYRVAKQFRLKIVKTRPSLVALSFGDGLGFKNLAGISIDSVVSAGSHAFRENILFTHRGMSGPAILQISNYWDKRQPVIVNLLPGHDAERLLTENRSSRQRLDNFLAGLMPARFVQAFGRENLPFKPMNQLTSGEIAAIAEKLNRWSVTFRDTEGYDRAEVTLGGIDTDELSSQSMEAKKVPGLYFIGEVVDVTGWLGGYNFQWAWASGHAAGQFV